MQKKKNDKSGLIANSPALKIRWTDWDYFHFTTTGKIKVTNLTKPALITPLQDSLGSQDFWDINNEVFIFELFCKVFKLIETEVKLNPWFDI